MGYSITNTAGLHRGFPNQRLTKSEKIKEYGSVEDWGKAIIEYIEELCAFNYDKKVGNIYNKFNLHENLQLIEEGYFDTTNFNTLIKPYGLDSDYKFPHDLTHYDIISTKIDLLAGEEIQRPFNYMVVNLSEEAASQMQELRSKLLFDMVQQQFIQKLQEMNPDMQFDQSGAPLDQEGNPINTLEKVEKYLKYTYSDLLESKANVALKFLWKDLRLEYLFNINFKKYLATGSEIYHVTYLHGNPVVRVVDPRFFDCDLSGIGDFIEDSSWCRELEYLTAGEIYDRYYDLLSNKDIEYIELAKGKNSFDYKSVDWEWSKYLMQKEGFGSTVIRVAHYEWKSLKRVKIVTRIDEKGLEFSDIENEDYKKKRGDKSVKVGWISERWRGVKIGDNVYINIEPLPYQYCDMDNLSKTRTEYIGTRAHYSIVDRLKPYQYLYNVVMYHLKIAFARSKGKGTVFDIAQIPKSQGWNISKWLYYLDLFGIAVVNSQEHSDEYKGGSPIPFQPIDRTIGQEIESYIAQLTFLKREIAEISGITPQREGQVSNRETLGGVERSINQSSAITETLFYTHNECKKRVLEAVLNVAKIAWRKGKKIQYLLDDLGRALFETTDDFTYSNTGVFVSDTSNDNANLQKLKQLAEVALQQKQITLKDFMSAFKTKSASDIERSLAYAEEKSQQREQEMQKQQSEQQSKLQQEKIQADMQKVQVEHQNQMEIEQLRSQTQIEVKKIDAEARIQSFRMDAVLDANNNGILDSVEREKIRVQEKKINADILLESKNFELKNKELDLKSKELNKPEDIEKNKKENKK